MKLLFKIFAVQIYLIIKITLSNVIFIHTIVIIPTFLTEGLLVIVPLQIPTILDFVIIIHFN